MFCFAKIYIISTVTASVDTAVHFEMLLAFARVMTQRVHAFGGRLPYSGMRWYTSTPR